MAHSVLGLYVQMVNGQTIYKNKTFTNLIWKPTLYLLKTLESLPVYKTTEKSDSYY